MPTVPLRQTIASGNVVGRQQLAVRAALLRLARRRAHLPHDVAGRVWTLLRDRPDFTLLDFAQRYTGTFGADGQTITGQWEISHDGRTTWERDFGLNYRRS